MGELLAGAVAVILELPALPEEADVPDGVALGVVLGAGMGVMLLLLLADEEEPAGAALAAVMSAYVVVALTA